MDQLRKSGTKSVSELISLLKAPVITEKSVKLAETRQYTFLVDKRMTKSEIKTAIEKLFLVKIQQINTIVLAEKTKRVGKYRGTKTCYKKAYIKLKEGYTIPNLFE